MFNLYLHTKGPVLYHIHILLSVLEFIRKLHTYACIYLCNGTLIKHQLILNIILSFLLKLGLKLNCLLITYRFNM